MGPSDLVSMRALNSAYIIKIPQRRYLADCPLTPWRVRTGDPRLVKNPVRHSSSHASMPSKQPTPLAVMPTSILVRSAVIMSVMASPVLLKPCLYMMGKITTSKSIFLNPTRNRPLASLLKQTVYRQFAGGENEAEVRQSITDMKNMGYKGVILGYAKEFVSHQPSEGMDISSSENADASLEVLENWKQGTLETLGMIDTGDFLALKFTGAGSLALNALKAKLDMPEPVFRAIDEICKAAAEKGCRLWVDAEQQIMQHGVDKWTIDLMRRHNRNDKALVFNTVQAYLKGSRGNIQRHLELASKEGWILGLKLVRGAYIEHETRSLIYDTKEETDANYDSIVRDLIHKEWPQLGCPMPTVELFIASHNAVSIEKAQQELEARVSIRKPTISVEYGQIQGMADDLSCSLLQKCNNRGSTTTAKSSSIAPMTYKCLTWGTLSECLGYLYRRAVENRGAVERTKHMAQSVRGELWRRMREGAGFRY